MSALLAKALADVRRRRAQSGVVFALGLLAALVATLSVTLLTRASSPFDEAFESARGAHLIIRVDAARATETQLLATAHLPGVTAAGPPRPLAFVPFDLDGNKAVIDVVGRDDPGGDLDRIVLVAGRWATGPGEIVVRRVVTPQLWELKAKTGDRLRALSRPDTPELTVVGEAVDLSDPGYPSDRAWVAPAELAVLTSAGQSRPGYEMAYRFAQAATRDDLQVDLALIHDVIPASAVMAQPADWLTTRVSSAWSVGLVGSALAGFTAFALVAVVLIVANAVAGAVIASHREIGIMKAIGFTPRGVAAVFVLQMTLPAVAGGLLGMPLGILVSKSLLDSTNDTLALPTASPVVPAIDLAVLLGLLVVVVIASLVPAARAGGTNAVAALSVGASPRLTGESGLGLRLRRLGLPLTVRLGVGVALSRSGRAILTLSALVIGVATMTTGVGLGETLGSAIGDRSLYELSQDVTVDRYGPYPGASLASTLATDPETAAVISTTIGTFLPDGADTPMKAVAVQGDSAPFGYHPTSGRWFAKAGEAVMTSTALKSLGLGIGDAISGDLDGSPVRLVIVGSNVDIASTDGMVVRVGWSTYQAVHPTASPSTYLVRLRPGADPLAYAARVQATEPQFIAARATDLASVNGAANAVSAIIATLVLVVLGIALVGVFNTMLLSVRERAFDNAVLKALGMTPRQVVTMVGVSAGLFAILAVVIGLPLGLGVQAAVQRAMADYTGGGEALAGGGIGPASAAAVVVGALGTALAGAALPARWAAAESPARVMRAE